MYGYAWYTFVTRHSIDSLLVGALVLNTSRDNIRSFINNHLYAFILMLCRLESTVFLLLYPRRYTTSILIIAAFMNEVILR